MTLWKYYAMPATIVLPLYCWTSLFFSIPLFIIEPIVLIALLFDGGSFSNSSNNYY